MPRRSSWTMGLRALALIAVSTGLLLGAAAGIAAATEGAPGPTSADPAATTTISDPAQAPPAAPPVSAPPDRPAAPPAPGGQADASSVTISRAGASALRSVSIVDFAFDPTALTVKVGDTVQWINSGTADEGHNVIGDGLQSPVLHTGESYSFTFGEAGSFSYLCTIHPKMTGTVEVVDPSADSGKKTQKGGGGKSSPSSGGGDSSDSSASSSATSAIASGSESAAGRTADAAGTSTSLPSTGADAIGLSIAGLLLIALGLALRLPPAGRLSRRG